MNPFRTANSAFALLTGAIALGLLLPLLAQQGMFMDGMLYAVVAHNQANGIGTFWEPVFSQRGFAGMTTFHEHPPLTFGLQAMWFRIFGDGFWVENLYCLVAAGITALLIARIWYAVLPHGHAARRLVWLPILLWIIQPTVHWCFQNNMEENTMGLFTTAAVLAVVIGADRRWWAMHALAGALVFLAVMSKGPPGLFPLAAPLLWWLATRQGSFGKAVGASALMLFSTLACLGLTLLLPGAMQTLLTYAEGRLLHRIAAQPTVQTHFRILLDLFNAALGPMLLVALIHFGLKRRSDTAASRNPLRRKALGLGLIGLAGVVPLMLTLVQKSFYMSPALPIIALALALLVAAPLASWTTTLPPTSPWIRVPRVVGIAGVIGVVVAAAVLFGNPSRDAEMIADVGQIGSVVPPRTLIGLDDDLWLTWNLQCYLMRHHYISCDPGGVGNAWHLSPKGSTAPGEDLTPLRLSLHQYTLWSRTATTADPLQ